MAGAIKHGSHRYQLSLQALTAGTSSDTEDTWTYDAFVEGGATYNAVTWPYDGTAEQVTEAAFTVASSLAGQATNFPNVVFGQARAGAVVNELRVGFSSSTITMTAYSSANLNVASGATVTGAGAGTLLVQSGAALPWTLVPGDILYFRRLSSTATGEATPSLGLNFRVKQSGA